MFYAKSISIARWLLQFIELHLFISILSLPILIYWGLPFSLASIIGNLVFAPFLAAFLFVSSLVFFTELLHIPNQLLIYILEKIGTCWTYLLSFGQKDWLIGFAKPPLFFLLLLPIFAIYIIAQRKAIYREVRIVLLIFILICFYGLCFALRKKENIFFIDCGTQKITALTQNNQLVLLDINKVSRIKSPENWIDYTLIPALLKTRGTTEIDHLIVSAPGQKLFEIITIMLRKLPIKNIYLNTWEGMLNAKAWHHYFRLKEATHNHDCTIARIGKKEVVIKLGIDAQLHLTPAEVIKKQTFSIPKINVSYSIDNKTTALL